jgi:hypothetical protein
MSFDPVSSQGLLHACFTGLAAAEAADAWIAGDDDAVPRYLQLMNSIQQSYRRRFDLCYASETRWPSAPFWQRRRGTEPPALLPPSTSHKFYLPIHSAHNV